MCLRRRLHGRNKALLRRFPLRRRLRSNGRNSPSTRLSPSPQDERLADGRSLSNEDSVPSEWRQYAAVSPFHAESSSSRLTLQRGRWFRNLPEPTFSAAPIEPHLHHGADHDRG